MNNIVTAVCMCIGMLLIIGGGALAVSCVSMKTTTTEFETIGFQTREVHVNNIGLIGKQESGASAWGSLAIVGAILFMGAWVIDVILAATDQLTKTPEESASRQLPAR